MIALSSCACQLANGWVTAGLPTVLLSWNAARPACAAACMSCLASWQLISMSEMQVVQTLSAGVNMVTQYVQPSMTLCNASGSHDVAVAEW